MADVDCFIIGHNEVNANIQKQIIRLSYGEESETYKERVKYNLAQIQFGKKVYNPSQLLNHLFRTEIPRENYQDIDVFDEVFSLTIAYLGTYLHRRGLSFDYINSFNRYKGELITKLKENTVLSVAITTPYYVFPFPILEIIPLIKKYSKETKIIVGGPYIASMVRTMQPDELQKLFNSIGADVYVNSAEGEQALYNIVCAIKNGDSFENIKNIYFKRENEYEATPFETEENCLDENYVDWGLFTDKMRTNVNIRSTVSCPYSCTFCVFPKLAGKYRQSSLETLEKELDSLKSTGKVTGFCIIDDTLNVSSERFLSFLHLLKRKEYGFKWSSFLRCQSITREMAALMKETGCKIVFCGIESGSQKILDIMNKKARVEDYKRGMEILNEYGIMSTASLIVGFPGETYETFMETFNFIEETKPTFFQERLWAYDKKSPIHEQRDLYNLTGADYHWAHASMDSNTAEELGNKMFFEIKNSIHVTEYPLVFNMLNRDIPPNQIISFFKNFNEGVKIGLLNPEKKEIDKELMDKLVNSFQ